MEGQGTHSYVPGPRNAEIVIDVGAPPELENEFADFADACRADYEALKAYAIV